MTIFEQLVANTPFVCAVTAWIAAQLLKVPLYYVFKRKWDLSRFFGSGGMPSSHSAATLALAISLGNTYGFNSPYFAMSSVLSAVVMYDAAGVRRAAGKQAMAINEIIELLSKEEEVPDEKLKELIGHTPIEVICGAIVGFFVALIFSFWR